MLRLKKKLLPIICPENVVLVAGPQWEVIGKRDLALELEKDLGVTVNGVRRYIYYRINILRKYNL